MGWVIKEVFAALIRILEDFRNNNVVSSRQILPVVPKATANEVKMCVKFSDNTEAYHVYENPSERKHYCRLALAPVGSNQIWCITVTHYCFHFRRIYS